MKARFAVIALAVAACSDSGSVLVGGNEVRVSVVNGMSSGNTAQLKLDQATVALPSIGRASLVVLTPGSHRVQLLAASGQSLVDTTLSFLAGSRPSVVLSGTGIASAGVSIATDTIPTNTSGNGYHSIVGSVLLVHSAPGAGPFDVRISQANSDSVVRMGGFAFGAGSLPPPAPYGFYVPFVPGTYTFSVTNPGSTTALASTQLTLATDDRWTVMLATSIEGQLVLQATKQ